MAPILDKILTLRKRLDFTQSAHRKFTTRNETILKTFFHNSFQVLNTAEASNLLPYFSKLLFEHFNIDSFSIYTAKPDGKMAKIYSDSINGLDSDRQNEEAKKLLEGSFKKNSIFSSNEILITIMI